MYKYLLLLLPITATGASLDLYWEHPTKYTTGAPLPISDILKTEIVCLEYILNGISQPCPFTVISVPAPATTYLLDVPTGNSVYKVGVRTVTKDNETSDITGPLIEDFKDFSLITITVGP